MSEYDPLLSSRRSDADDLERVRARFEVSRRAYLWSPIPWLVWALILPGAALATPRVLAVDRGVAVIVLWSVTILLGAAVEGVFILRRRGRGATPLGMWAMRVQGNLSLVGLALSLFLLWFVRAASLPVPCLLLIGHSFFTMGGLAFRPMRQAGLVYQLGGVLALWPGGPGLYAFAVATGLANLRIAVALMASGDSDRSADR